MQRSRVIIPNRPRVIIVEVGSSEIGVHVCSGSGIFIRFIYSENSRKFEIYSRKDLLECATCIELPYNIRAINKPKWGTGAAQSWSHPTWDSQSWSLLILDLGVRAIKFGTFKA